jgi:hypothetical protein
MSADVGKMGITVIAVSPALKPTPDFWLCVICVLVF